MALDRLWVLGAGTALPSAARNNTMLALEVASDCWLIDCSGSPYQRLLRCGLDPCRLCGVLLTHSHPDHIYGLPALLFQLSLAGYEGSLPIYGLPETLQTVRHVVDAFELGEHCAAHEWRTLPAEPSRWTDRGVTMAARPVCHSRPALGYRLETPGGGAVAYSGDSGPCPAVVDLARDAEWLIHECTVSAPMAEHSTPEQVAADAREAGVARLGLVHYDPLYVLPAAQVIERIRQAGYGGEVRVLEDMEALTLD